jgi:hypothetical protein
MVTTLAGWLLACPLMMIGDGILRTVVTGERLAPWHCAAAQPACVTRRARAPSAAVTKSVAKYAVRGP